MIKGSSGHSHTPELMKSSSLGKEFHERLDAQMTDILHVMAASMKARSSVQPSMLHEGSVSERFHQPVSSPASG